MMRKQTVPLWMRLALGLIFGLALAAPIVHAQPSPPELGSAIVEDPLTGPGVVSPFTCRTQRSLTDFVGEGFIMKVAGPCGQSGGNALVGPVLKELTVPDGEVRVEMKAVSGLDRTQFVISIRRQTAGETPDGIYGGIQVGVGRAAIVRWVDGHMTVLAGRDDLKGTFSQEDWNNLALRAQGSNYWLMLNDQPILSVADSTFDTGIVIFYAQRLGEPNDDAESAVVVRNLRVSALAQSEPSRVPIYQRP